MGTAGSGKGAKYSLEGAECRCGMLFEILGMLTINNCSNILQLGEERPTLPQKSSGYCFWKI
jgi:hypothetical protein